MTIYEKLIGAGLADQIDHHESDLYVFISSQSTKIIGDWLLENNYGKESFISAFTDQITGKRMFDIPFAYDPWWAEKCKRQNPHPAPKWATLYNADYIRTIEDEEKTRNYEVIFQIDGVRRYCFISADSIEEALGVFFQHHPDVTYNDVVDHCEA